MSKDSEILDIARQLQGLQLQQATLISRLTSLTEPDEPDTPPPPKKAAATRELAVGDKVRIRNPRILQEARGKISRIGLRITVMTPKGNTIVRAPKNLVLEEQNG